MGSERIRIHYHRDFDGVVSAAVLAAALRERAGEDPLWQSVNYDQREDWRGFEAGRRFAIVDFHFHPRAEWWFDHHPTTFLDEELRAAYTPGPRWSWDETSPSCPPLIIAHMGSHHGWRAAARFEEMARWSDIVDAARYSSVDQALFGEDAALRITRAMTAAPSVDWVDSLVEGLVDGDLERVASRGDVEKSYQRATRNRDKALEQFPPTVKWKKDGVLVYDASSNQIRRERFAPFYHHPDARYAVGVIPTRAGYHVSAGENPWNQPVPGAHVGQIMERYGGGGHKAVGGANPHTLEATRQVAEEVGQILRRALLEGGG